MKAFFKYSTLYLCALIFSALGVVFISNPFKDKTAEAAVITTSQDDETAFDKLVAGVMSSNGLDLNCDLIIDGIADQPIQVKANILLDFSHGFDKLALKGDMDAFFNAQNIKLDFTYVDNFIYAALLDNKFKINSSNIMDIIGLAMNGSGVSFASSSMSDFSLDQVMYALQNMTDTPNENGHALSLNLLGIEIVIQTDFDYQIKAVNTGEIKFGNITITPNIGMKYLEEPNEVVAPSEKHVDVTAAIRLVNSVKDLIASKRFNTKANLTYGENTYSADIKLDINNGIKLQLNSNLQELDIDLTYVGDTIFANIGPLHAKFDIKDVDKLVAALQEFNIDISNYLAIIENVKGFDFSKIDINSLDFSAISLKFLKDIVENGNNIEIELENIGTIVIAEENGIKGLAFASDCISADLTFVEDDFNITIPAYNYIDVTELLQYVPTISKLINNINYNGAFNLEFKDLKLDGTYHISYLNNEFKAELQTSLFGLNLDAKIINNVIYANIAGLDVCFGINELPEILSWVNKTFKTKLALDNSFDFDFSIKDIHFIELTETGIAVELKNGKIELNLKENIDFNANFEDLSAFVTLQQTEDEITVNTNNYKHYSVYTALIENIISTFASKQLDVTAKAKLVNGDVVKLNAECDLQLDLTKSPAMFAELLLTGEKDFEFNLAAENDMWYLNYNKLKVKMSRESLLEILNIVCSIFGVDTSSIEILQSVSSGESFDVANLQQVIPSLDFKNPLNMLKMLKHISYNDDVVTIVLDGKFITENENAMDVTILIVTANNKLESISIKDFYTGIENEKFDLSIMFHEFGGVKTLPGVENYIDLSDASGLVRALVNTTSLSDFHITADLDINMEVLSINKPIKMTVPVDIQVKIVDKKPQIMAVIGPIPVIAPLDDDVPYKTGNTVSGIYSGLNRILEVYYADGFVYFYRSETVPVFLASDRKYEKMYKITLEEFLADPMLILSYGCGFKDIIMDEIQKAMDLATNRETPMDLSNILLGFEFDGTNNYSLTLNLAEIANNPQLDKMTISLATTEINGKQFVTNGTLNMHMPIASAFKLDLNSNNLSLKDVGTSLDFNKLNNFVANYPHKVGEKWEAYDGDWSLSSATTYTVHFETNGGAQLPDIVDAASTEFDLPILETRVVDDGLTRKTYTHSGWFTSSDFEETSRYTRGVIGRGDITLYAKWDEAMQYYYNIDFVNEFYNISAVHALASTEFEIELSYEDFVVSTATKTTTYAFAGWFVDSEYNIPWLGGNIVPEQDITLYANWVVKSVVETKLVNIFDNGKLISSTGLVVGEELVLPSDLKITSTTKWFTDEQYVNEIELPNTMPNYELNLHIRNLYSVTIVDQTCGNVNRVLTGYQGEVLTLPTDYATKVVDDGTLTKQETFTFAGFDAEPTCFQNQNITIHVEWNCDVKYYYTVTFSKDNNIWSAYKSSIVFPIENLRVLEGTKIDLSQYTPTWEYKAVGVDWYFAFKGWATKKGGNAIIDLTVTGDTTIYANWSDAPKRVK